MTLSVTVWNEYRTHHVGEWMNDQQREQAEAAEAIYPDGIHATIASFLAEREFDVRTALLDEPEHGLSESVLDQTDVLVWWSHYLNDEVDDAVAERIVERVRDGMGLVALHSARRSKVFQRLMGTTCGVRGYRDRDETERVWVVDPGHPIADGLDEQFIDIPESQIVAEPFDIPEPDRLVMTSWIEGGEVFRSGCCFQRGTGRIFFFGPGHETHPVFHQPEVQQVVGNAVEWAAPTDAPTGPKKEPSESLPPLEE